jgi:hypothetical protein
MSSEITRERDALALRLAAATECTCGETVDKFNGVVTYHMCWRCQEVQRQLGHVRIKLG